MQWLQKWGDWLCGFDGGGNTWLQVHFRRLFVCISVAQQSRLAPGWAHDGEADRKAHHGAHGHGEVRITCDGREQTRACSADLIAISSVDLPCRCGGWT